MKCKKYKNMKIPNYLNRTRKQIKKVNRRGQSLGGVFGAVVTIAAIGILLALMMYVFVTMGDTLKTPNTAATVVNEVGFVNSTTDTLNRANSLDFVLTSFVAMNMSTNATIVPVNYTLTNSTGTIVNATATNFNLVLYNYTYTYSIPTSAYNATGTLVEQFVDFLPWLGIILLVVAAGVVLFFVIRSFSGTKISGA